MSPDYSSLHDLEISVRALVEARKPAELFKRLLEGSRLCAPRAAVFLFRQGEVKGWGSVGYDRETAGRQRSFTAAANRGWFGALAAKNETVLEQRRGAAGDPDFGQPAASESLAIAVRVKNRAIAVLLAERSGNDNPWIPPFLSLMVRVAQLRLEVDLLLRKVTTASQPAGAVRAPAAAPPPGPPTPAATPVPTAGAGAVASASLSEAAVATATELAPAPAAAREDDKEVAAARRFAKLVATDIRLYNEEAVLLGRRNGDLGSRLAEHLTRGKETFVKRHGNLGPAALQILHEAYVQVLAAGNEELLPASALD